MSGLVIAQKIEMNGNSLNKDELKADDAVIAATTASPSEPDADAIKMFVGQIPRHWNETDCRRLFETFGPVYSCNILRDKSTQSSKGCCFVTFYHRKHAIDAQGALHNIKTIDGMHHPVQMKPADTENRNDRKLFVGQLSKRHTEEDLRQMFAKYGQIEDCSVLRDNDGKSRGCAFVTFTNRSCAVVATKEMHHSQTMEGCAAPLVVKFADTQKDKDVKQKAALFVGNNSASPKSGLLGNLNPALIQQLGGQNVQAVTSILSLLGGQQAAVNQQQNVLGLLGTVLSALGKLTENGSEEGSSSKQPSSSSPPNSAKTGSTSNQPPPPPSQAIQQQQTQQQSSNVALGLPLHAVAQAAPTQLDAFTQAQMALAQQNQILALQGFAVQQQHQQQQQQQQHQQQQQQLHLQQQQPQAQPGYHANLQYPTGSPESITNTDSSDEQERLAGGGGLTGLSPFGWNQRAMTNPFLHGGHHPQMIAFAPAAFGLAGGLAGAKTTSPVAASLPTHAQTIALTPFAGGTAVIDPYQTLQQQYALFANIQATAAGAGSVPIVGNGDVKGPDGANLFIYHLPQDFGDSDLLNTFSPFGSVLSAKVFIDKVTNLSKCFGFVSFDNPQSASNAIQAMNGFQIGSKRLKVQLKDRGKPYNR